MANVKTIIQDVLNILLVFALGGMALESKLQPLVTAAVFNWVVFVLMALWVLVYFADIIFGFQNPGPIAPPPVIPTTAPAPGQQV